MNEIKLAAQSRDEKNGGAKRIRTKGFVPAVIYGQGIKVRSLKIKQLDFERVFTIAGESNLIDLTIGKEKPIKVIIKDTQKDRIKENVIHVDFYQVNMNKKITTEIPLNLIGESKAESELGGTLMKNMDSIEVTCLPGDLIDHIDVDLSELKNLGDAIRIGDLNLPNNITVASEQNEVVVSALEPQKAEEIEKEEVKEEGEAAEEEEDGENKEEGDKKKEEKGGEKEEKKNPKS